MTALSADTLIIRVGSLIDGISAQPIPDARIRIQGSTIMQVGPWVSVGPDQREAFVDLTPYVAVPGFVDVHAHMTLFADGRSYEEMASDPDERMLLAGVRNARTHLRSGITTVRDNGSRNRLGIVLRDAIETGLINGPRLLVSGRPITQPGGHFHFCNGEAEGSEGIRFAVEQLVAEGVDHIKVMASGGGTLGTDPRRASYSIEELRTAVEAAHASDRLTTAHCRALASMDRAVAAGLDCMEHAEFLRPNGRMEFDAGTAESMKRSGIHVSPTLQANGWDTIGRLREEERVRELTDEERKALVVAEEDTRAALENFERMLEVGLGPRMVGGTDAGCFDFSFGHIDYCLKLMERGGMTRMEALQACTSVAAEAIGLGETVGALAVGRRADVVILGGDPLGNLEAVADVRAVLKQGRVVTSALKELPPDPGVH